MNGKLRAAIVLVALVCALGACKETDVREECVAPPPVSETPVASSTSPDPAAFPMLTELPGEAWVAGEIEVGPALGEPGSGGACPIEVTGDGSRTGITVRSVTLNCCTERIRASVERVVGGVDVRFYEYLPDICECMHARSLRLTLAPFDARGLEVRVYMNGATEPCGAAVVEGAGD